MFLGQASSINVGGLVEGSSVGLTEGASVPEELGLAEGVSVLEELGSTEEGSVPSVEEVGLAVVVPGSSVGAAEGTSVPSVADAVAAGFSLVGLVGPSVMTEGGTH